MTRQSRLGLLLFTLILTGCYEAVWFTPQPEPLGVDTGMPYGFVVTKNSADPEFWAFEARVQMRSQANITYGRAPQDYPVPGSQEHCEAIRARVLASIPTEPCRGPFHYHPLP